MTNRDFDANGQWSLLLHPPTGLVPTALLRADYDTLLALDEAPPGQVTGIPQSSIERYPVHVQSES